jgi:hypothetical protein
MHGRRILTRSGFGACTSTEAFGEKLATSNSCVSPSSNRLARCFAIRQLYGWHTPSGAITLASYRSEDTLLDFVTSYIADGILPGQSNIALQNQRPLPRVTTLLYN